VARTNVGATLVELGGYDEALQYLEPVLELRAALPPGHEDRLSIFQNVLAARAGPADSEGTRELLGTYLADLAARARSLPLGLIHERSRTVLPLEGGTE